MSASRGLRIGVLGLGRIGRMHAAHLILTEGVGEVVLIGRDAGRLGEAAEAVEGEVAAALGREAAATAAVWGEPARDGVSAAAVRPEAASRPGAAGRGGGPGRDGDARESGVQGAKMPSVDLRGSEGRSRAAVSRRLTEDDGGHLEGLDGLVIATSTASHPDLIREAAAAGLPVLAEKPLALDPEAQDALIRDLADAPAPVMLGYHRRYDPAYRDLRSRVRTGEMGRIRLVHAVSHDHHHVSPDYVGPSGGIWRDLAIHDFDAVPWLLGEQVRSVYATGSAIDGPGYAEQGDLDTAMAILTFASGAQAVISAARNIAAGHDVRTEVYGSEGAYGTGLDGMVPVLSTEPGIAPPGDTHEEFTDRFGRAFRVEAAHFVSLLRGEAENLTPPAACADALRLALAAEESVRTGLPVAVPAT